jgi:hypothetical protein
MKRIVCSAAVFIVTLLLSAPIIAGEYSFNNRIVLASLTIDEEARGMNRHASLGRGRAFSHGKRASSSDLSRALDVKAARKYLPATMSPLVLEDETFHYYTEKPLDFYRQKATPDPAPYTSSALDFEFGSVLKGSTGMGVIDIGAAVLTQVLLHEAGHYVMADYVGAEGSSLAFLTSRDGQFFLGSSTVTAIDDRSRLPYNMGGEVAADVTFEYALSSYRKNPTLYNKALMLLSGTDLLRYTLYAFLLSDGHDHLDPIAVTKYSGASKEALISVAVAKTVLNAYRIHSGRDTVVPYFTVDKESAILMLRVVF